MAAQSEVPSADTWLPKPVKDVLTDATTLVSLGTTAAFLMSVVHEQAYFLVVGRKFQGIASLSDYLTNVLDWLPAVAGGLIVVILYHLLTEAFFGGSPLGGSAKSKDVPRKPGRASVLGASEKKLGGVIIGLPLMAVAGYFAYGVFSEADPASHLWRLSLAFLLFWIGLVALALLFAGPDFMGRTARALFLLGPPLIVFVFLRGLDSGYGDMRDPAQGYTLVRQGGDAKTPESVSVLKVFDRGILVRWPEQKVSEFIRWDQIHSIRRERDAAAAASAACRRIGWDC